MRLSYNDSRARDLYYRLPPLIRDLLATIYSARQRSNRFGGVFTQTLSELIRNSRRPGDERAADQLDRLRTILKRAGAEAPYYNNLFGSVGFDPGRVRGVADLRSLPLLDKETIRYQGRQLRSTAFTGPVIHTHTSGTTGKGLHLVISQEAYQRSYACMWYHYTWVGVRRRERVATIAGHPVASPKELRPPYWTQDWLEQERFFSSQHLGPATLPSYAESLDQFHPSLLRGYPSSIYPIAAYLIESGRSVARPKAIVTSSETLFDRQRAAISRAFGCPILSYYSNAERAAHILQCPEGNFHVATELCVVEVLRADGSPADSGETGEMVCTSLIDHAMPLIRYRIGDTAVVGDGPCQCGNTSPTLKLIVGRVEDVVLTPEGRRVGRLDHVFKDLENVYEAQIIQDEIDRIVVRVVPRRGFDQKDERVLLDELRLRLGEGVQIRIETVEAIPRTKNGKFRFVVSSLATGATTGGPGLGGERLSVAD
jgi:phenylacetate-CoA ligase